MFLGRYQFSLDSKARLTIPSKYREMLAPTLIVTRHPVENCLIALPISEWSRWTSKVDGLSIVDTDAAHLRRILYGSAEDLHLDSQGRVLLTQRLREIAHIDNDVLIVAAGTYLEIWNPADWLAIERQIQDSEARRKAFASLGV
jgi:MraZ protein